MSAAESRSEGVAALTLSSDPPLCQRGGPQAAVGALWIISGLLHFCVGLIFIGNLKLEVFMFQVIHSYAWLGVPFVFFGVFCILTERHPRACLILLSGLLNLSGAALSIAGIVLYSTEILHFSVHFTCQGWPNNYQVNNTNTDEQKQNILQERCAEGRYLLQVLFVNVFAVLVTLSTLDLCLGISSSFLSFSALKRGTNQSETTPLPDENKATSQVKNSGAKQNLDTRL